MIGMMHLYGIDTTSAFVLTRQQLIDLYMEGYEDGSAGIDSADARFDGAIMTEAEYEAFLDTEADMVNVTRCRNCDYLPGCGLNEAMVQMRTGDSYECTDVNGFCAWAIPHKIESAHSTKEADSHE